MSECFIVFLASLKRLALVERKREEGDQSFALVSLLGKSILQNIRDLIISQVPLWSSATPDP